MASVKLRIGPPDHGRRMTLEEFREAEPQEGYRYELAQGLLEVTEIPNDPHGQIVDNLHETFVTYRRQNPGLILRIAHASDVQIIILETESDRHPDLSLIFRDTPRNQRGRRPPRLVVEVVSPGKEARERDYVAKREDYLAYGIREYWIVDPQLRQVAVLSRRDGPAGPSWAERTFRGEEAIVSELLPGFVGTVAELWADAEPNEPTEA